MALLATNAAAAKSLHAVADAAERLRNAPAVEVKIATAPSDLAFADGLRRNLHPETMAELETRLARTFVRKTGA